MKQDKPAEKESLIRIKLEFFSMNWSKEKMVLWYQSWKSKNFLGNI